MSKLFVLIGTLASSLLVSRIAATGEREDIPLARQQSHDSLAIQGKSKITWKRAVGQQVTAQGIAWGKSEKGLGDRVILDGTTIYVAQPVALDREGHLVEVSGKLEIIRVAPAPLTSQGFGPKGLEYYAISGAKWRYVDAVSSPMLVVHDRDSAAR